MEIYLNESPKIPNNKKVGFIFENTKNSCSLNYDCEELKGLSDSVSLHLNEMPYFRQR